MRSIEHKAFRPVNRHPILLVLLCLVGHTVSAEHVDKEAVIADIDSRYAQYQQIAMKIWDYAELGYLEDESSALLQQTLELEGFDIETGVAGLPTAFVASAGDGGPVIALLAEFDALPGISQSATPYREIAEGKTSGHACGHHLFGTASVAAAIAIKRWLRRSGTAGTIRVYGTPAEEGGSGKVYMVRAGLFEDVDAVFTWHPSDRNDASARRTLANRSAIFRFTGVSAHAANAPHKARSALDGVEAFNHMINLMREHVPQETRIHYVISSGGKAPNVVPDYAEVYYYVRHPNAKTLLEIWERVGQAAEGAALGTGTTVQEEIMHGNHSLLPNETFARLVYANLVPIGGVSYSEEEQDFARRLYATLDSPDQALGSETRIQSLEPPTLHMGSTDVGDVSWTVPTGRLSAATWVPGTSAHTWQAIAAGGKGIGIKGMQLAAKGLALTIVDLFTHPLYLEEAKKEFTERRGEDFVYEALLGDREPPLDYRK